MWKTFVAAVVVLGTVSPLDIVRSERKKNVFVKPVRHKNGNSKQKHNLLFIIQLR